MLQSDRQDARRLVLRVLGLGIAAAGAAACTPASNAMPTPEDGDTPTRRDMIGKSLRVVRPGMFVTQEFNPERITIHVDEDETIEDIRIG